MVRLALVCLLGSAAALSWYAGAGSGPVAMVKPAASTWHETAGTEALYDRLCTPCHGADGRGVGPATPWIWPRPRDFTRGEYKWRSTPSGAPPEDSDLARTIRYGVAGTSMHGFGSVLNEEQIAGLVSRVKSYAPKRFAREKVAVPLYDGGRHPDVARGKVLYRELGCEKCHGDGGRGDGPSAKNLKDSQGRPLPPYDLTREPLHRPGPTTERAIESVYQTLTTGLMGTPMPSYQGVPPEDLWAVAAFIDSIRYRGPRRPNGKVTLPEGLIRADRKNRTVEFARSPGANADEKVIWGQAIPFQGQAPEELAPAQASLSAQQCARCHAKQAREWNHSFHAAASSPGVLAQLLPTEGHPSSGGFVEGCQRCHAPLAEQNPLIRPGQRGVGTGETYTVNDRYNPQLRKEGINCASCHVRNWTRHGPPKGPNHSLLGLIKYPTQELAIYERADMCMGCHQLPPRTAVNGKPRLNTYREWLESPYMRRGVQCQHCHMPNREHTWKGVHDPSTFRQGITVHAEVARDQALVRVTNSGAGHYLPTTPTPAAWLSMEVVNDDGERVGNLYREKRIGWHLSFDGGWKEIEDTRIPPGDSLTLRENWRLPRDATHLRVRIRVIPDDFYEGFYKKRLNGKKRLTRRDRQLFEQALERAEKARYTAYDESFPIGD